MYGQQGDLHNIQVAAVLSGWCWLEQLSTLLYSILHMINYCHTSDNKADVAFTVSTDCATYVSPIVMPHEQRCASPRVRCACDR